MAKQPIAGRTKTRLTPALTFEEAAKLYHYFLQDKIQQMSQVVDVEYGIAYTPASAGQFFGDLAPRFHLIWQGQGDLSQRLKHVVQTAFAQCFDQVVAIDGDSVSLPPSFLQQAFTVLDDNTEVSLGPCEDGGYYAIGMNAPHLNLFDVQMSTPNVTKDTLHQAKITGLKVALLPTWYDVDTLTDLERLADDLRGSDSFTARHLAHFNLAERRET